MKVQVIKIGNSKGLRLPKYVLEQCGIEGEVELDVRNDELVIKPTRSARKGWEEAFQAMAERRDDRMVDFNTATKWDHSEWEW